MSALLDIRPESNPYIWPSSFVLFNFWFSALSLERSLYLCLYMGTRGGETFFFFPREAMFAVVGFISRKLCTIILTSTGCRGVH
jgi:hypothetical protein